MSSNVAIVRPINFDLRFEPMHALPSEFIVPNG